MKTSTFRLPCAVLLTLAVGAVPLAAQATRYSDIPPDAPPPAPEPVPAWSPVPEGTLNFFTDRASFQAAFPGLTLEDFSENNLPPNSVATCTDTPVDSTTNDQCFSPGDVVEGIALDDITTPNNMVLLTPPFFGTTCDAVGPNTFVDDGEIVFDPAIRAVGFDMQCNVADTIGIEVFGPGGSLGSTSVPCPPIPGQVFFGVETVDPGGIVRLTTIAVGDGGELVCDVEFGGNPVPVELQSFDVD